MMQIGLHEEKTKKYTTEPSTSGYIASTGGINKRIVS